LADASRCETWLSYWRFCEKACTRFSFDGCGSPRPGCSSVQFSNDNDDDREERKEDEVANRFHTHGFQYGLHWRKHDHNELGNESDRDKGQREAE